MNPHVLRFHYLFFFGALGIYVPYLPAYFRSLGMSGTEIGALFALLPLAKIALPPLVGPRAGHPARLARLVRLSALGSLAAAGALAAGTSAPLVWGGMVLLALARAPTPPLVDALALRTLAARGERFGRVRVLGSLGYVLVVLGAGPLLDRYGIALAPRLLVVTLVGVVAASVPFRPTAPAPAGVARPALSLIASSGPLRRLLLCTLLHSIAANAYSRFFTIHLDDLGHPTRYAGYAWALGVGLEMLVLHEGHRLLAVVGARRCLHLAYAGSAVRWFLTAHLVAAVPLILVQTLHGLSFGLFFLASVSLVQGIVEDADAATAQGLFTATAFGVAEILGSLMTGAIYQAYGGQTLYAAAGVVAVLTVAVASLVTRFDDGRRVEHRDEAGASRR